MDRDFANGIPRNLLLVGVSAERFVVVPRITPFQMATTGVPKELATAEPATLAIRSSPERIPLVNLIAEIFVNLSPSFNRTRSSKIHMTNDRND